MSSAAGAGNFDAASTGIMTDANTSNLDQPFALVADADVGMRMSLTHLFSVIFRRPVRSTADCADAACLLGAGLRPRVLVVGRAETAGGDIALIRAAAALPDRPFIIALDRQATPEDGVEAFLAGADDVVRPPFPLKEFALRLRARLGPAAIGPDGGVPDMQTDWDAEADIACRAGLTSAEAQVVHVLISQSGQIVTRDALSQAIDRRPWAYGDRKFDVHVAKIRKKLTAAFGPRISVRTVRSSGYRLTLNDAGPTAGPTADPQGDA